MESNRGIVRVKKEPNDTWPDAGNDYNFNPVDSSEAKNSDTLSLYESSANRLNEVMTLQEESDEKIFIDLECQHVKPELKTLSTIIHKTEHPSIVKIENQNQSYYLNGKYFIILIKKDFDYHNKCKFQVYSRLKCEEREEVKIFKKNTQTKLLNESKMCRQMYKETFGQQGNLKQHIIAVHDRSKPFECEICHKSFGQKFPLKRHIITVHDRTKSFECDICQRSFGQKCTLKSHKVTVHDRSKPFECDICYKSFGENGSNIYCK
uniref:C2H2-type domain-containing protein n=1 Tax=Trichogramma kaykai TaxID=54128 RepID=A0ABD2X4K7_9HYME